MKATLPWMKLDSELSVTRFLIGGVTLSLTNRSMTNWIACIASGAFSVLRSAASFITLPPAQ